MTRETIKINKYNKYINIQLIYKYINTHILCIL